MIQKIKDPHICLGRALSTFPSKFNARCVQVEDARAVMRLYANNHMTWEKKLEKVGYNSFKRLSKEGDKRHKSFRKGTNKKKSKTKPRKKKQFSSRY